MRLMGASCYKIHTINDIALYTAPVEPRNRVVSYDIDMEEMELDFDIKFFFLDAKGNIVDDFEGNKNRELPVTTDMDSFAHIFGSYFTDFHYEPAAGLSLTI